MTRLLFIFMMLFKYVFMQGSYRVKNFNDLQEQRLKRFYGKAIDQLSNKKLYSKQNEYGLGVYASSDSIWGSSILEIINEYTIASFDSIFPDHEKIRKSFHNIDLLPDDQDLIMLIFNIIYKRNTEKSKFMKIFFDNIPNTYQYTPLWDDNEKAIFRKLLNQSNYFNFQEEFFSLDTPVFNYIFQYKMDQIRENRTRFIDLLDFKNIFFAANIAYSKSMPISYKSYKQLINVKAEDIKEKGIIILNLDAEKIGFIYVVGLELLNHHSDSPRFDLVIKPNKLIVKANRKYKKDEEITSNYAFKYTTDFFKSNGFTYDNMYKENIIQKFDDLTIYSVNQNSTELKTLCFLLNICRYENDFSSKFIYKIPYYSNNIYDLKLYRSILKNWLDQPLNDTTHDEFMESVKKIKEKDFSNITFALALSEHLEPLGLTFKYLFEEGLSIEGMLEWYKSTERSDFDLHKFLSELRLGLPNKNKVSIDMNFKIKETLKFALFFYHNSLVTFKENTKTLQMTLDNLMDELREKIIDKF